MLAHHTGHVWKEQHSQRGDGSLKRQREVYQSLYVGGTGHSIYAAIYGVVDVLRNPHGQRAGERPATILPVLAPVLAKLWKLATVSELWSQVAEHR